MACEKNRTKLFRISRTISSAFGGSQILANSGQHLYDQIKYLKKLLAAPFNLLDEFSELNGNKDGLQYFLDNLSCDNHVKNILSELFPKVKSKLSNYRISEMEISRKLQHCSIMDEDYFDLYFTFDNTDSLSQSRIYSLISSSNESAKKFNEKLFEFKEMDLLLRVLYKLKDHINKFTEKGIINFITVLINDYGELFSKGHEGTDNSLISGGISLIVEAFNNNPSKKENFINAINNAQNNYFKVFLVWDLNNYDILTDELSDEISDFLQEYFNKTEFSKIEHPRTYIYFLKQFTSFEVCNNYIQNLNDENLISLIREFEEYSYFYEKNIFEYDNIKGLVDISHIKKCFERLKEDNTQLYIENKELMDLFLEDLDNQS